MEAIPVISSGLFAGFALSVSAAEHPARKAIDPQQAVKQFTISYKRAAFIQIGMGVISGSTALYLATTKSGQEQAVYAAAGVAMLAMTPFTIIFLLPTNNRLTSPAKKEDAEVKRLFAKWEGLHAVRTVVSILAFAGLTAVAVSARK